MIRDARKPKLGEFCGHRLGIVSANAIDNSRGFRILFDDRNALITLELSVLNSVLSKIDKSFAIHYYESIKEIALKIAQSSGGALWIKNSISPEEAKIVGLPMVNNPATS